MPRALCKWRYRDDPEGFRVVSPFAVGRPFQADRFHKSQAGKPDLRLTETLPFFGMKLNIGVHYSWIIVWREISFEKVAPQLCEMRLDLSKHTFAHSMPETNQIALIFCCDSTSDVNVCINFWGRDKIHFGDAHIFWRLL